MWWCTCIDPLQWDRNTRWRAMWGRQTSQQSKHFATCQAARRTRARCPHRWSLRMPPRPKKNGCSPTHTRFKGSRGCIYKPHPWSYRKLYRSPNLIAIVKFEYKNLSFDPLFLKNGGKGWSRRWSFWESKFRSLWRTKMMILSSWTHSRP